MTWFSQRSPIVLVDVLLNCVHGDARHTLYSHMGRFWACGLASFFFWEYWVSLVAAMHQRPPLGVWTPQ